jgi:predicted flap endonuclease-1-like 5' DNA nuclease
VAAELERERETATRNLAAARERYREAEAAFQAADEAEQAAWRQVADTGTPDELPEYREAASVLERAGAARLRAHDTVRTLEHQLQRIQSGDELEARVTRRERNMATKQTEKSAKQVEQEKAAEAQRKQTVKRIVQLRKQGMGLPTIAKTLNEEGVPTFGRGSQWYSAVVRGILVRELGGADSEAWTASKASHSEKAAAKREKAQAAAEKAKAAAKRKAAKAEPTVGDGAPESEAPAEVEPVAEPVS